METMKSFFGDVEVTLNYDFAEFDSGIRRAELCECLIGEIDIISGLSCSQLAAFEEECRIDYLERAEDAEAEYADHMFSMGWNTQHTSGPWFIRDDNEDGVVSIIGSSRIVLAKVRTATVEPGEANARLIAAAPRMSAALKRAAYILSELPQSAQTTKILVLRREIIEAIKAPEA